MDFGTKCLVCLDEIAFEDPLIFKRIDGRKVPCCSSCIGWDWNIWGSGNRWLSGRTLEALPCYVCGRQMLLYWMQGDNAFCSQWCRREAHRDYNRQLREACK